MYAGLEVEWHAIAALPCSAPYHTASSKLICETAYRPVCGVPVRITMYPGLSENVYNSTITGRGGGDFQFRMHEKPFVGRAPPGPTEGVTVLPHTS